MTNEVTIEPWEGRTGWAVISGADDYEPNVRAFFPDFSHASMYVEWCQSNPDHDARMTEPCIVAAVATSDGIDLANHYDYELGAKALCEKHGIRSDLANDYIKSGRAAMRRK